MQPLVSTVILNFNRWDNTIACLRTLAQSDYPRNQIIVVDIADQAYIPKEISAEFPQVEIVRLRENRGYAGNNNQGIQHAIDQRAEWIFILNDDTLVASDCISWLIDTAASDERIGFVGPIVYHADEPGIIQSAGGYFDHDWHSLHYGMNQEDQGQFGAVRDVDWLNGCGFLCRVETLQQIGFFDEAFFLYNEEVEFCLRATEHGWKIKLNPQAKLWHKGVSRTYTPSANVTYYMVRNQMLFLQKHHAPLRVKIYAWYERLRMIASYTLRPKWKHARDHRDAAVQGLCDFVKRRWGKRG